MNADRITEALKFDPLAAAEKITGHSYKDSDDTSMLGLALGMSHNERKDALLAANDDTRYSLDFEGTRKVYASMGFEEILSRPFQGRTGTESWIVLWHVSGILATLESYGETRTNSTKVYYNWRPNSLDTRWEFTSSGRLHGDVWVGYHDAREGVRHNITRMKAAGEFLPVWTVRPWLWLLNSSDDSDDYKAINAAVIAQLPQQVQDAITPAVTE